MTPVVTYDAAGEKHFDSCRPGRECGQCQSCKPVAAVCNWCERVECVCVWKEVA